MIARLRTVAEGARVKIRLSFLRGRSTHNTVPNGVPHKPRLRGNDWDGSSSGCRPDEALMKIVRLNRDITEHPRVIGKPVCDEMHDFSFFLYVALDAKQPRVE
jgi:hypothetical protein